MNYKMYITKRTVLLGLLVLVALCVTDVGLRVACTQLEAGVLSNLRVQVSPLRK